VTKFNSTKKHDLTIVFFYALKDATMLPSKVFSGYFYYGDEAMQFTYFRIPYQPITHPQLRTCLQAPNCAMGC